MSLVEENVHVTQWVGPTSCKNALSVVVISTDVDIINKISHALSEVHSKGEFQWKLVIVRSFHLEEIVRQSDLTGRIAMDFIIIGLDTSKIACLDWAKKAVEQIHPDLRRRRIILVNASGLPTNGMAVSSNEFISLQKELNIDIMSANVYKHCDATSLARKLLKYMETSVGVNTGLPNLNV